MATVEISLEIRNRTSRGSEFLRGVVEAFALLHIISQAGQVDAQANFFPLPFYFCIARGRLSSAQDSGQVEKHRQLQRVIIQVRVQSWLYF